MLEVQNQIKEVLKNRGVADLQPTLKQLEELGATPKIWRKWVRKTTNPSFEQVPAIAAFIGCEINDLFPKQPESQEVKTKHFLAK
jgi:transcriptional regulator with XRE-family HTH domain